MKLLMSIFVFLIICLPAKTKHLHHEKEYQEIWCKKQSGQSEVQLVDYARVDCITDTEAVEFDFAKKWAECTGQALYYGLMADKTPACVLIMENGKKDTVYLKRLKRLSKKYEFKIYTMTPKDIKEVK